MKKYRPIIILVNLLLLLVFFNNSLLKKEALLSNEQLILLELAPADPRSLMQGDYMRLRYKISRNIKYDSIPKRGFCVVKLQANGVAEKVRMQEEELPISENEYLIKYTAGNWDINIGAESFFFQEGEAEKFEKAKYGALRVDNQGNSLLIGLYDEKLQPIK